MSSKILILVLLLVFISCQKNPVEEQLQSFIKQHLQRVEPLMKELNLSYWNATASGKKADYDRYAKLQLQLKKIYSNREEFAQLKGFKESGKVRDPLLARQLTLLYNKYLENQIDTTLMRQIVEISTAVENTFNVFRGEIDGEKVTNNQISDILRKETDWVKRKKAWEASKQVGQAVADEILRLVRLRNRAARQLGFDNYYTMALTLAEQSEEELVAIFEQLADLTDQPFRELKAEIDSALSRRYGVTPEEMRPWGYQDPFFQEPPQIYEVSLDKYYQDVDIKELARKFYNGIGLIVDDVLARSDLYERPGKYPHAYCTDIDRKGDVRVMANLKNNEYQMDTILHELGHSVYSKYIDPELPFLLRQEAHTFTTEAIAMLFGRLAHNPLWLNRMGVISDEEMKQIRAIMAKNLRMGQLVFARWCQVMFHFERNLYRDPDQDLNKLWWDLVERYQYVRPPEGRDQPDWAAKIHICSAPVYYHNYMLGEMLASQLHAYIVKHVLKEPSDEKACYVNCPEVGRYLKEKVFKPGARYAWNDLIKYATGEPLTPKYFVKQFVEE